MHTAVHCQALHCLSSHKYIAHATYTSVLQLYTCRSAARAVRRGYRARSRARLLPVSSSSLQGNVMRKLTICLKCSPGSGPSNAHSNLGPSKQVRARLQPTCLYRNRDWLQDIKWFLRRHHTGPVLRSTRTSLIVICSAAWATNATAKASCKYSMAPIVQGPVCVMKTAGLRPTRAQGPPQADGLAGSPPGLPDAAQPLPSSHKPSMQARVMPARAISTRCRAKPALASTRGCHAKPPVRGPKGRRRRREPTVWRAVRTAFQRSTGEQRGSCATLRSSSSTAASTLPRCSSIRPHACHKITPAESSAATARSPLLSTLFHSCDENVLRAWAISN